MFAHVVCSYIHIGIHVRVREKARLCHSQICDRPAQGPIPDGIACGSVLLSVDQLLCECAQEWMLLGFAGLSLNHIQGPGQESQRPGVSRFDLLRFGVFLVLAVLTAEGQARQDE